MVRSNSAKLAEGAVSIAWLVMTLIVAVASRSFCSPFVPVTTTVSSKDGGSSGFWVGWAAAVGWAEAAAVGSAAEAVAGRQALQGAAPEPAARPERFHTALHPMQQRRQLGTRQSWTLLFSWRPADGYITALGKL